MNLTPTGFWIVVAILCCVALVVVVAEILRDRDNPPAPQPAPVRDVCDLQCCDRPARVVFHGGTLDGLLYICEGHAGKVSQWAPVIGTLAPFDQEAS